jgi:hypothetical protein
MLEGKKDGLAVYVESTKVVGDVSIGICFDVECNGCSMSKLCGGSSSCCCESCPVGSEESALCYALYLAVRQVLCGDPLAVSKTKVGSVSCVAHNGMFGINWKVKGTASAVRKSIGLALKVLDPVKMFPAYSRHIKQLGGSAAKESFNYVADAIQKTVKSLTIGIVGNIKLDSEKLKTMLEVLTKKHNVSAVPGTKTKPSGHKACEHNDCCDVKVSGWASAVVSDFIMAKVKGLTPCVCDKHLHLHLKAGQWDTLSKKLKKYSSEYATNKYGKVGDNLPAVFGYLNLANGSLCAGDVKTAISSKLSASAIESVINKAL